MWYMLHFGQLIKTLRNRSRMRQSDLAAATRMSIAQIQNIERRDRNRMRWSNYRALCNAFKMTEEQMDALIRGEDRQEPLKVPLSLFQKLIDRAERTGETVDAVAVRLLELVIAEQEKPSAQKKGKRGVQHVSVKRTSEKLGGGSTGRNLSHSAI